ncbi:MAG: tetratricopeptide repeat protein [Chitinophagales bacterium]
MSNKKNKPQRIGSPTKQAQNSATASPRTRKRKVWWKNQKVQYWLGTALVLTLLAYLPALFNGFVNWDDPYYLRDNTFVKKFDLGAIFTKPVAGNYHPLTMLSLAIEYQLVGMKPFLYHFTNVLLHLLNTTLVFYFIYLISNRKIEVAGIVALFFGIHPMHVESVAWISERKDVLHAFFYLAALVAYTRHVFHKKRLTSPKIQKKPQATHKYLAYMLLFFMLSLLSKAVAVTVPVVMVLLDIYLNRIRLQKNNPAILKQTLLEKVPFFVISLIFGFIALNIQKEAGAINEFEAFSPGERFAYAAYGFLNYIGKFFFPINLVAYYPYPDDLPSTFLAAPLVVLGLFAAAVYTYSKSKIPLFGLSFYAVTVALVLQFISVGVAIVADRYTYIPYIGLLFILAMGFHHLLQRKDPTGKMWQNLAKGALGLYAMVFLVATFQQTRTWNNSKILWDKVLTKFPDTAWIGYMNRATYYFNDERDYKKALTDYSTAIRIHPTRALFYYSRGLAYEQLNQNNEALNDYSKAIQLDPGYQEAISARANIYKKINPDLAMQEFENALQLDGDDYKVYINRGSFYRDKKEYDKALQDFDKAAEVCNCFEAYFNRAGIHQLLNNNQNAIADFTKAIEVKPSDANGYINRGNIYRELGQNDLALQDYTKAMNIKENYDIFYNMGLLYSQMGQNAKSLEYYTKAIALSPERADAYTNRGNVYFAAQQLDLAIADYNKSIDMNPEYGNAYGNRGAVNFQKKNYNAALQDFAKALEIDPDHKDVLLNRAATYLTLNNCELAKPDLEHLLSLNPNNGQAKKWLEKCK